MSLLSNQVAADLAVIFASGDITDEIVYRDGADFETTVQAIVGEERSEDTATADGLVRMFGRDFTILTADGVGIANPSPGDEIDFGGYTYIAESIDGIGCGKATVKCVRDVVRAKHSQGMKQK